MTMAESKPLKIGLTSGLDAFTGWGVVMLNTALELASRPDVELSFWAANLNGINALDLAKLEPIARRCQQELAIAHAKQERIQFDGWLLHVDGNHCGGVDPNLIVRSDRNVGLMVFEDTALTAEKIARLQTYQHVVTA